MTEKTIACSESLPCVVELGGWRVKRDHRTYVSWEYSKPEYEESDWEPIPAHTHLQPYLHPDDPYWKEEIRRINDDPWWYRTEFALSEEHDGNLIRVKFEGVDYYSSVWVNGHLLGHHEGSFAPFEYDITDHVSFGKRNLLAVKVESPWDTANASAANLGQRLGIVRNMIKGMYEHADGLFPPYVNPIGIWRPVKLIVSGHLTIDQVGVVTKLLDAGRAELTLKVKVTNSSGTPREGNLRIRIEGETFNDFLVEEEISRYLRAGSQEIQWICVVGEPRLWWPWDRGQPDLYRARIVLK